MAGSSLINGSFLAHSKRNHPRNQPISIFTPHHAAGNLTFQGIKNIILSSREMSCTYMIQSDGKIFQFVDEGDRPWTSSSPWNDHRAITVEVANDGGAPDWHVSDLALESLINLGVDICRRYGLPGFDYTGDKNNVGTLTMHNYFQNTECPGPYLSSKFPYIDSEIKKRLKGEQKGQIVLGSIVDFRGGHIYASSTATTPANNRPASRCIVTVLGAKKSAHPYHIISQDAKGVYGWANATDVALVEAKPVLYATTISGANEGDKNTIEALAKQLQLPYETVEVN